eukprot:GFYU01006909.1.p1 GENE.GFYU01006909.1~~GFYU01006909.1.p1  ORF type:complete len:953 (-),score=193.97 GFYU01006909.1:94-2907(-)
MEWCRKNATAVVIASCVFLALATVAVVTYRSDSTPATNESHNYAQSLAHNGTQHEHHSSKHGQHGYKHGGVHHHSGPRDEHGPPVWLLGRYEFQPVVNGWLRGTIEVTREGKLQWRSANWATWSLELDLAHGLLRTAEDNPAWSACKDAGEDACAYTLHANREGVDWSQMTPEEICEVFDGVVVAGMFYQKVETYAEWAPRRYVGHYASEADGGTIVYDDLNNLRYIPDGDAGGGIPLTFDMTSDTMRIVGEGCTADAANATSTDGNSCEFVFDHSGTPAFTYQGQTYKQTEPDHYPQAGYVVGRYENPAAAYTDNAWLSGCLVQHPYKEKTFIWTVDADWSIELHLNLHHGVFKPSDDIYKVLPTCDTLIGGCFYRMMHEIEYPGYINAIIPEASRASNYIGFAFNAGEYRKVSDDMSACHDPPPVKQGVRVPRMTRWNRDVVEMLEEYGGVESEFSQKQVDCLDAFFTAENMLRAHHNEEALDVLRRLWELYPIGEQAWYNGESMTAPYGLQFGLPTVYYGLRMLTEIAEHRLGPHGSDDPQHIVKWQVTVVPEIHRVHARNMGAVYNGTGDSEYVRIDERVDAANGEHLYDVTSWVFREYVTAITDGILKVELNVRDNDRLYNTDANGTRTEVFPEGRCVGDAASNAMFCGMHEHSFEIYSPEDLATVDWWWVIYPSVWWPAPEDLGNAVAISGGMGGYPHATGQSPIFIADDVFMLHKLGFMGSGTYSELESRAWMPQWFAHEFYHHVFLIYKELDLDRAPWHSWFDRAQWPDDFEGLMEMDYFQEALHKRLRPLAGTADSLAERLTPHGPAKPMDITKAGIHVEDLYGTYERRPVENTWHTGTIKPNANSGRLTWTNAAGVSWTLSPALHRSMLESGSDNPYFTTCEASDQEDLCAFILSLRRQSESMIAGDESPWELEGFRFFGELYVKVN